MVKIKEPPSHGLKARRWRFFHYCLVSAIIMMHMVVPMPWWRRVYNYTGSKTANNKNECHKFELLAHNFLFFE